jgi:hypothetical protein
MENDDNSRRNEPGLMNCGILDIGNDDVTRTLDRHGCTEKSSSKRIIWFVKHNAPLL